MGDATADMTTSRAFSRATLRRLAVAAALLLGAAACTTEGGSPDAATTAVTPPPASPALPGTPTTAEVPLATLVETQLRTYSFFDHIRAVLVQDDGELVVEKYFDTTATVSRDAYSVTKSVTSTLVGIAVAEGLLPGLDADLATLLPDRAPAMTPEVAAVTLRQLLTMTSGLPDTSSTGMTFTDSSDWVARILAEGLDHPAGTFAYGDANSHLCAAVLARAIGGSVFDYAAEKLFEPIGIPTTDAVDLAYTVDNLPAYDAAGMAWFHDPQGVHLGATDLKLTPRDMLALGRLYLDGGQANGRRIVPADWIVEATSEHTAAPTWSVDGGYGYFWWTTTADGEPAYAAIGYGGQLIEVVPSRGLVVVVSSDLQQTGDPVPMVDPGELMTSLVSRLIAPAVR
jgi:CubicO group peptidase (beta-lactamase class C family)